MKKSNKVRCSVITVAFLLCSACANNATGTQNLKVIEPTTSVVETIPEEQTSEVSLEETSEATEISVDYLSNGDIKLEKIETDIREFCGWEFPTAAAVLNYYGFDCNYMDLLNYVEIVRRNDDFTLPKSPNEAYIGNPTIDRYGFCYSPVLTNMLNNYISSNGGGYTAVDISGTELQDLVPEIKNGNPVIIWSSKKVFTDPTAEPENAPDEYLENGDVLKMVKSNKPFVITNYNEAQNSFEICDVFMGQAVEIDLANLQKFYDYSDKMSVVIHKN